MTYSPTPPPQSPPPISEPPPPVSQRPPRKRGKLLLAATVAALTGLGIVGAMTNYHHSARKATAARPSSSPVPSTQAVNWKQMVPTESNLGDSTAVITSFFAPLAKGHGVAGSAAYTSDAHPMAFVDVGSTEGGDGSPTWEDEIATSYQNGAMDTKTFSPPNSGNPLLFTDTSQVQLVAVVADATVQGASCGTYTRQSDGMQGEVQRTEDVVTITIRAALTGQVIATKKFTSLPSCPQAINSYGVDPPPWSIGGSPVNYDGSSSASDPAVKKWIDSFLTGPVHKQ